MTQTLGNLLILPLEEVYWFVLQRRWIDALGTDCGSMALKRDITVNDDRYFHWLADLNVMFKIFMIYRVLVLTWSVLPGIQWAPNTVKCHYNMVQHNMILHIVQQWLTQNMIQRLYSQKTPHTSPSRASYGVFFVAIWVTIDHVIMAPHQSSLLPIRPGEKEMPISDSKYYVVSLGRPHRKHGVMYRGHIHHFFSCT